MVRIKCRELIYMCQFKQTCHLKEPKAHRVIWIFAQRHGKIKAGGGEWKSVGFAVLWLVLMNWWGDGWPILGILKVDRNLQNKDVAGLPLQRFSGQDYISTGSGDQRKQDINKAILQLQLKILLKYQMHDCFVYMRQHLEKIPSCAA